MSNYERYSPIKNIHFMNFRNIKEASISFEKSPIISLVGDNDAGKTSLIKGCAVLMYNKAVREQKDFIRTATNMFGVAFEFNDGTMIQRKKGVNVNSYLIKNADGTVNEIDRVDNGVPPAVQEILGVIEEPETKEALHVRTYEDKLMFVVTPSSSNYKMVYTALKVSDVTNAIKYGSEEVNGLRAKINANQISIDTLMNNCKGIHIADVEQAMELKIAIEEQLERVKSLRKALQVLEKLREAKRSLGLMQAIKDFGLEQFDEYTVSKLLNVDSTLSKLIESKNMLNKLSDCMTLSSIDYNAIQKMSNVIDKKGMLNIEKNKEKIISQCSDIQLVDEQIISRVSKAVKLLSSIKEIKDSPLIKVVDIKPVDEAALTLISNVMNKKDNVINLKSSPIYKVNECDNIDENIISKLDSLAFKKEEVTKLRETITELDNSCAEISSKLLNSGVAFETCPKCGEQVLIDLDKVKGEAV